MSPSFPPVRAAIVGACLRLGILALAGAVPTTLGAATDPSGAPQAPGLPEAPDPDPPAPPPAAPALPAAEPILAAVLAEPIVAQRLAQFCGAVVLAHQGGAEHTPGTLLTLEQADLLGNAMDHAFGCFNMASSRLSAHLAPHFQAWLAQQGDSATFMQFRWNLLSQIILELIDTGADQLGEEAERRGIPEVALVGYLALIPQLNPAGPAAAAAPAGYPT